MTITVAPRTTPEGEIAWDAETMRQEPADSPRLAELLDEVATTEGRLVLTRPDGRHLVVLPYDEFDSIELTLEQAAIEVGRWRRGELPEDDDPDEPHMDEAELRQLHAELLRRIAAGAKD